MVEETRRLAAIMLTDLVGYTALSQRDEGLALRVLEEHSQIVLRVVPAQRGRVVKCTGDGYLAEFTSALDALRCAVSIQDAAAEHNAACPAEEALHLRIGLHLGDVVERAGDVFGDGVNILARIELLAEPEGICLSQQFYDQVWNKTKEQFVCIGPRTLKGISQPVTVYRVVRGRRPGARPQTKHHGGRRIAVLPLVNTSPDPSDAYFADGLTEELIYTLTQLPGVKVIAYTSARRYRGTDKTVSEIGSELGVESVIEGSVRKAGDRLRITLQLIDCRSQAHLWAQACDGALDDVFALQSDVARKVAGALRVKLLDDGSQRPPRTSTSNMDAYAAYLKGRHLWNRRDEADLRRAISLFRRATQLDGEYAPAHVGLADALALLPGYGTLPPHEAYPVARAAAQRALELDDSLAEAHASLGIILAHQEFAFASARRELEQAISLNPNYAMAHHWYALVLMYVRRHDEAVAAMLCALDLDPLSLVATRNLGRVLLAAGCTEEALVAFRRVLELDPSFPFAHLGLACAHLHRGEIADAAAELDREQTVGARRSPWLTVAHAVVDALGGKADALAEAERVLAAEGERRYVPPSCFAVCHLLRGDLDHGFSLLEKAFAERDEWLLTAIASRVLDPIGSEPRFEALLARLSAG